jgi:GNAT superfamily N-acetyltransferase
VTDVAIREARPDEVSGLARLAEAAVPIDVVAAGGQLEGDIEQRLASDRVFVAECEGRRAGYAAVTEREHELVLDQLVVAPTDHGRHVGHALLDWVEGYGVSRSLHAVVIDPTGADDRARDFYTRRGYLSQDDHLRRELVHV